MVLSVAPLPGGRDSDTTTADGEARKERHPLPVLRCVIVDRRDLFSLFSLGPAG